MLERNEFGSMGDEAEEGRIAFCNYKKIPDT